MAIILTGGAGNTALNIARSLQEAKIKFLLASRRGESAAPSGMHATKFDWLDPSTFDNPFQHKALDGESVSAVYLVWPETLPEPGPPMTAFIDRAVNKYGVKRFVLLGGTGVEMGGVYVGKVWQHLVEIGTEFCVLLPTWFMENLLKTPTIKDEGKIYTACEDGKIPFVSATDIAAVGFRALTDEKSHNTSYYILGPELLTYDQIAAKFSSSLGREVVHVKLSQNERVENFKSQGMSEYLATFLAWIEADSAGGSQEKSDDSVEKVTGRPPKSFDAWLEENKATWQ